MAEYADNVPPIDSRSAAHDRARFITSEMPCPYLAMRQARSEAYYFESLDGAKYELLLACGYRRSGRVVYRPRCRGCSECKQVRIPVDRFEASKSMRRTWRRNQDVIVRCAPPDPTDEKFEMFTRYLQTQHDDTMPRSRAAFAEFLYDSPMETLEFTYRLGRRTIGASIADLCPGGLSSVYCYFDPEFAKRSLGTFSVLWELDYCRTHDLPYYYMGYYIADCPAMAYKVRFRPSEILVDTGRWLTVEA